MAVDAWEWLSLIDTEGPFLSRPALKSFYPTGLPSNASLDDLNATFVAEFARWSSAWTTPSAEVYNRARDRWVESVLRTSLEWSDDLALGPAGVAAYSPDRSVSVTAWAALNGPDGLAALVSVVDRTENLRKVGSDGWAADAIDRTSLLLRESGVTIGIVTDGRWWALVSAEKDVTTASGVWDALLWRGEERQSRDAFFALANYSSIAGGAAEKRLPLLFAESVASAEQITEALGDQVRRAVELVLQSMSDTHLRALAAGEHSPLPGDPQLVYEAAVTVLMRVVFLLFAEERLLLPDHDLYRSSYAIDGIRKQLQQEATETSEEALDHTSETWHRLLAASNAVFGGASFEDMRMPAYGGSLFDPVRFPWLQATDAQGRLRVRVSDRTMLAVLRAVQTIEDGAMQLSFRELDVEQIGYVYEGLLGYSAEFVDHVVVGLKGKNGYEPEIPLVELEAIASDSATPTEFGTKLIAHLKKTQENSKPSTTNQIAKSYGSVDQKAAAKARTRLRHALLGDDELVARLAPFHGIIRDDLRGFPYVVPSHGVVMTESPQRSNTGTHYTPRSLAEEVVLHALEPLVYSPGPLDTENSAEWVLKSSAEILDLRVADIAVGSGAFLVAAARYLAARLLEARRREGIEESQQEDLERWAIREIVARCLYGADINGMAVEMCKLSLWLISMDPGKPFSFVDDRVFHGNSLLGVTTEAQLKAQHIYPKMRESKTPLRWFEVDKDLADAALLRRELASGQVDDADRMRSTRAKLALLSQSRQITMKLRDIADGIVASGLREGARPGNQLDDRYDELADALRDAYPSDGSQGDRKRLRALIVRGLTPTVPTGERQWRPLHWIIEAPDVLSGRGGFDAVIGNPPFLGGSRLSGASGTNVRDFLVHSIADGKSGNADLVAYFILRARRLLRTHGVVGLIATNTVTGGPTRDVSIGVLAEEGDQIYRAIRSAKWPSRSASIQYSAIWLTGRTLGDGVERWADGVLAPLISASLLPVAQVEIDPVALRSNSQLTFEGCKPYGEGFVIDGAQAARWLAEDPRNAKVLFPYLTGQDVNSRPDFSASRWVIDFDDMPLEEAETYVSPAQHVRELVKPERDHNPRKSRRERWWQFGERSPGMRKAIAELDEVLVISLVSNRVMPLRVSSHQVLSNKLGVFATDSYAMQSIFSSSIHWLWSVKYSATLGTELNYTPTRAVATFPRPESTLRLDSSGRALDSDRTEIMFRRGLGLTQLYNLVHSSDSGPDIEVTAIRQAHVEVDQAVLEAFGWSDVHPDWNVYTHFGRERFSIDPDSAAVVLERLLHENHRRASLESHSTRRTRPPHASFEQAEKPDGALF